MRPPDLLPTARQLIDAGDGRGVTLRLIGGLAFRARVAWWEGREAPARPDIDLVIHGTQRQRVTELLLEQGYLADRQYNALYGDRQLYFFHPTAQHAVDVVVDRLVMCHTLDLRGRLALEATTVPLADLLLSKLQIIRFNTKDALDVAALLATYELTASDGDGIALPRLLQHTSNDWGWWRTTTGNLLVLRQLLVESDLGAEALTDAHRSAIAARLAELTDAIGRAPKSARWRLRGAIGDRLAWYDEPEEVAHDR